MKTYYYVLPCKTNVLIPGPDFAGRGKYDGNHYPIFRVKNIQLMYLQFNIGHWLSSGQVVVVDQIVLITRYRPATASSDCNSVSH